MKKLHVVNASDKSWCPTAWILTFGAYGDTYLLAFAKGADSAFDLATAWLADNKPGILADCEVEEDYRRGINQGLAVERAMEIAEVDCSVSSDGHYVHRWEWTISGPVTAKQIADFVHER